MLTQEELKRLLHYNPDTGVFTRRVATSNSVKVGDKAGGISKTNHGDRYSISVQNKTYLAHRLAWFYMTGKWPTAQIDHKDMDGTNNKWENLREADNSSNGFNKNRYKNNQSGIKGLIYKEDPYPRYVVRITGYKRVFNKSFAITKHGDEALSKALTWLDTKREELHKDFGRTGR